MRFPQCFEGSNILASEALGVRSVYVRFKGDELPKCTVVYCHGNAENLYNAADFLQMLSDKLDADVHAFEYPGYSSGDGSPSDEACYTAAAAFTRQLRPRAPLVVVGFSMGCAPALHAATSTPGVAAVVLLSPFVSAASVVLARNAEALTWNWLYRVYDVFCTLPLVERLICPLLVVHGARDAVVPSAHGRLVSAHAAWSDFVEKPEAAHADIGREAVEDVRAWVMKTLHAQQDEHEHKAGVSKHE